MKSFVDFLQKLEDFCNLIRQDNVNNLLYICFFDDVVCEVMKNRNNIAFLAHISHGRISHGKEEEEDAYMNGFRKINVE